MSTLPVRTDLDDATLHRLLRRAVAAIVPEEQLVQMLKSGRRLRLKMGFDPTRPDLTLGHAVGLRKLRQLQELGHKVVLIVGDWTAQIGDPSGQSETRPLLTRQEVEENAATYLRQFFKVVDREQTEVRWQSEWLSGFGLGDVIRLASRFTVAQMLAREDFAKRYAAQRPIYLHEFLYPLIQAYDSVMVQADVEFGGTDQTFNLLMGRELQEMMGQPPQVIFTVPLLVGTDGRLKMSKSAGNYIALEDPPEEMYGKVMSLPDGLILDYFRLVTDVPDDEIEAMGAAMERGENPMTFKKRLAWELVRQFHGPEAAAAGEAHFTRIFQERQVPEEMPEVRLTGFQAGVREVNLPDLLTEAGLTASRSEARRLIQQGGVEVDGERAAALEVRVRDGSVIRAGKRRWLRVTDAGRP